MKKLISLLLALCLLLTAAAASAQTITAASGLFTYEVPDDYIRVDGALLEAMITTDRFESILGEDADPEMLALFLQRASQMDFSVMEMVDTPDLMGDINIQLGDAKGVTPADLPEIGCMLDEMLISGYIQLGMIPSEEYAYPMDLLSMGDNLFYALLLNIGGVPTYIFITYAADGTVMASLTMNGIPEDVMTSVLTSFAFIPQ